MHASRLYVGGDGGGDRPTHKDTHTHTDGQSNSGVARVNFQITKNKNDGTLLGVIRPCALCQSVKLDRGIHYFEYTLAITHWSQNCC